MYYLPIFCKIQGKKSMNYFYCCLAQLVVNLVLGQSCLASEKIDVDQTVSPAHNVSHIIINLLDLNLLC